MRIESTSRTGNWVDSGSGRAVAVSVNETTLSQLADRLQIPVAFLRAANPTLRSDSITAGQILQLPPTSTGGNGSAAVETAAQAPPELLDPDTPVTGDPMARTLAEVSSLSSQSTSNTDASEEDGRFTEIHVALQAGDGEKTVASAKTLLVQLQQEKPPNTQLVNKARMSLAAGAMLAGDLDTAQSTLLAINAKTLGKNDADQYAELVEVLKNARREAFTEGFESDVDKEGESGPKRNAAEEQAVKLLELLRKTNAGEAEISEARLKHAHALLTGDKWREAEKTVKGMRDKSLDEDQREYLKGIRTGVEAGRIHALAKAYDYDMRRKNFKDAAINATVMANNLAAYFPESQDQVTIARLKQVTAQVMKGDMEDARKSLSQVNLEQLKQLPAEVQKRYKSLNAGIKEHFENVKKEAALKAEVAAIENQIKTIDTLASSNKKGDAAKAVSMAEELLAQIQQKYADNPSAIAGAKLTVANTKLAAGDRTGAKADLQSIVDGSSDPAMKDRARLVQARAALIENQTHQAMRMLQGIRVNGATPDLRKATKDVIISVEANLLTNVRHKLYAERERLDEIHDDKRPQSKLAYLNPLKGMEYIGGHYRRLDETHENVQRWLDQIVDGVGTATALIQRNGLTLAELRKMNPQEIAKLPGASVQSANAVASALGSIVDCRQIAEGRYDEKFSWESNTPYVDPSYLDHTYERSAKWIGEKVREARARDEDFKSSDSIFDRVVGYGSGAILDAVSATNSFIKDKIRNAAEFYNDPERKDTWYAALGRAGTFGADLLTAPVTMPATIADYKASDAERAEAMLGTFYMAATMGAVKGAGSTWKAFKSVGSSVGGSTIGRLAATSQLSRLAGMAQKISGTVSGAGEALAGSRLGEGVANTAQKIGGVATRLEGRFEATSVARGMDAAKAALGKLNPTLRLGSLKPTKAVDEMVDELMHAGKSPVNWRASVTEADVVARREAISKMLEKCRRQGVPEEALRRAGFKATYSDDEIRRMVIGERIYDGHYKAAAQIKKADHIDETAFKQKLQEYGGPKGSKNDYWHRRYSSIREGETLRQSQAWMSGDVRRFYFNVKPDNAVALADHVAAEINRRGLRFQFKMPSSPKNFDRLDSAILYVERNHYAAVKEIVDDFAKKHPNAFAEGSPAMTHPIGKGISVADEPLQAGLPSAPSGTHSFGSSRSQIMAEVILEAPPYATRAQMKQLVRERLKHYNFDPDRPWLRQGTSADDISGLSATDAAQKSQLPRSVTVPVSGAVGRADRNDDTQQTRPEPTAKERQ